jgi:hypothetical protein
MNQQQRDVIEYLQEENRVLRQQLGNKRLRLSDDQRRCLRLPERSPNLNAHAKGLSERSRNRAWNE